MSPTLMCPESFQTGLTNHITPVDRDVNANCENCEYRDSDDANWKIPLTRGGKLGLLNAFRSYDEALDTLLPRNSVWLKYKLHSNFIQTMSGKLVTC